MSRLRENPSNQLSFDFREADLLSRCGDLATGDGFELKYYVDEQEAADRFGQVLPSTLADFVDVAVAVHMADRLSKLPAESSAWCRSLPVVVPVRDPDLWNDRSVRGRLEQLLQFLTEDDWSLSFQHRCRPVRMAEGQGHLFRHEANRPVKVGLLSGGLDSFAGIGIDRDAHPDAEFVCVSAVTNPRHAGYQRRQASILRTAYSSTSLLQVQIRCWLQGAYRVPQEQMRRTRGFLFLTFGLAVARQAGAEALSVYENGVGALNLAYERGAAGVLNSRAVHPKTLRLMAELFEAVTGQRTDVVNPHGLQTKSQMCAALPAPLQTAIDSTYSCDSAGSRRAKTPQCGTCTSCLLRRVALHSARVSEDPAGYGQDVRSAAFSGNRRHTQGLDAMTWQVERISACLSKADRWPSLVGEFPELQCVVQELERGATTVEAQRELTALYARHCRDWRAFAPSNWPHSLGKAA